MSADLKSSSGFTVLDRPRQETPAEARFSFLPGDTETAAVVRGVDWGSTLLGPVETWSSSLRTAISICMLSRFPMAVCWGPRYVIIYNDGYAAILGTKHPWAMGRPCFEVWSELAHIAEPMFDGVMATGVATWSDDLMLPMRRHGYLEEAYFTVSYSAIRGESNRADGVFVTVTETTERFLAERRLALLRELGDASASVRTVEQAVTVVGTILARHPADVPYSCLYMLDGKAGEARLATATGLAREHPAAPACLSLTDEPRFWPLRRMSAASDAVVITNLQQAATLPGGIWPDPSHSAVLLPIARPGYEQPVAAFVAGVNPRRALDERHHEFFRLIARQISNVLANAIAHEEARKRAEALAELDRAKTAFFSNVSHEFRTPLTLMLGPLEDALAQGERLSAADRERIEVAHRNCLRLLKLVNTLLDFSRIEAGRIEAAYEPVDLSAFTAELASVFRSAIERARLRLIVDCRDLGAPVYVDRGMWEKIVFNLLSNAFKFTFEGEIEVAVHREGEHAVLAVRDTGTGIPAEELPHLFERFHRVAGARGRSFEGSGIGLALVQELARLHGGSVGVASAAGHGSTFRVTIPFGKDHLPADRIGAARTLASTQLCGAAYAEEAVRWLGEDHSRTAPEPASPAPAASGSMPRSRILIADDNADMREYLRRLLAARYEVEAVANGLEAHAAATARPPDLLLSDVMMPGLDGFALLRELRADERTRALPVILLSARAGEEAKVQGLEAAADDYLVKPFTARELEARIDTHLRLARLRREAAERERTLRSAAEAREAEARNAEGALREIDRRRNEFLAMLAHELRNPLAPICNAAQVLKLLSPSDVNQQWAREVIERQAQHLTRLVDDLLDVSRITQGKISLARDLLPLTSIVERAVEASRPLIDSRRQELRVELPPDAVYVEGDLTRLVQVIGNLLNNAAKYTDEGGHIWLEARAAHGQLALGVRDDGMGISADLLPHVFDLFTQAHRSLDRSLGGLGIGLTLVQRLVELHGGSVEVRSEGPGRGSEFLVRLPIAKVDATGSAPGGELGGPAVQRGARLRVLVVEDNADSAQTMAFMLRLAGHEVRTAQDGLTALTAARSFQPQIVLCDIGLPGMNGYEVATQLRADPNLRLVRLIALTGYGQEEDHRRARDAGFDYHLTKPVEPEALLALLTSVRQEPSAV